MIKEATIENLHTDVIKSPKIKDRENLKQRAYLNTVSNLIDYAGAQITGMITSPFIVHGLGNSMYGIWQIIGQLTGYAKMADARAMQVLKWTVAKKKDIADEEELRSDVSSAVFVTISILPLVLLAGGIISWYAPYITKADPKYYNLIRITCSIINLAMAVTFIFDVFDAVLRGMNLGFKRMGFRAGIVVFGGVLKVLVITLGFGLIGLSIVQLVITTITGFTFYFIVKKSVGWFGFGKTSFKKVVDFSKISGWNMANTMSDTLLTQSDKVLLGFVGSPILVSSYALTTFLPLAIQGVLFHVIIGIIPGIGKLLGLKEYQRIHRVWGNMNNIILLITTASGVAIILFNNSFLKFWVGEGHFAGNITNTAIIVMLMQDTFIKNDGYIITATLDLKKKIILTLLSAVVFIGLGSVLINYFGITGLCLSIIFGKFLLFNGQRRFLRNKIQYRLITPSLRMIRPLLISFIMLGAACLLSMHVQTVSLLQMIGLAPITFIVSFFIFYHLGLRKEKREALVQVLTSIKFFKSN